MKWDWENHYECVKDWCLFCLLQGRCEWWHYWSMMVVIITKYDGLTPVVCWEVKNPKLTYFPHLSSLWWQMFNHGSKYFAITVTKIPLRTTPRSVWWIENQKIGRRHTYAHTRYCTVAPILCNGVPTKPDCSWFHTYPHLLSLIEGRYVLHRFAVVIGQPS